MSDSGHRVRGWLWLLALALTLAAPARSAPRFSAAIDADNLALIVDVNDPTAVVLAEDYRRLHGMKPTQVVAVRWPPETDVIAPAAFTPIRDEALRQLPDGTRALALFFSRPWRVGCMSVTSAFAFGFDSQWCASGCAPTKRQGAFNRPLPSVAELRPTMLFPTHDLALGRALMQRSHAAFGSGPAGTAYLLKSGDRRRAVRFDSARRLAEAPPGNVRIEPLLAPFIRDRDDVLFYFIGTTRVVGLDSLGFVPGALADHLTSFGGVLFDGPQMSVLRWLEAGASASYGTVVEPCNLTAKFPNPEIVVRGYAAGLTALEAYWHSVGMPGQGLFVGDPLTRPFATVAAPSGGPVHR